jgi:hypothetical protein
MMALAYTEIEETIAPSVIAKPPIREPERFRIEGIHFIVVYIFILLVMTLQ